MVNPLDPFKRRELREQAAPTGVAYKVLTTVYRRLDSSANAYSESPASVAVIKGVAPLLRTDFSSR